MQKYTFILQAEDKTTLIRYKNIELKRGALKFFKDIKHKLGIDIIVKDQAKHKSDYFYNINWKDKGQHYRLR